VATTNINNGVNRGFQPSLIIKPSPGKMGYHPAQVIHNPAVTQSPFAREKMTSGLVDQFGRPVSSSILSQAKDKKTAIEERMDRASQLLKEAGTSLDENPLRASELLDQARNIVTLGDPYTLLHKAYSLLESDDVETAGKMFRNARIVLEADGDTKHEIYNMAVLGEARYGDVDDTTFDALSRVKENYSGDENKLRYEQFVRATAYLRVGNESAADDALLPMTMVDSPNDVTTLQAWVAKADLYMSMGLRTTHDARNKYLTWARDIMVNDVPRVLDAIEKNGLDVSGVKNVLAQLYASSAEFFIREDGKNRNLTVNYPLFTRDILGVLIEKFGDVDSVKETLDTFPHFVEGGKLKPFALTTGDQLRAAALEFFYHMKFPARGDYWKLATAGSLIGILAGIAIRGGDISFYNGLADSAKGAVALVGGAKTYLAANAPETRQAYKTGFSNKSIKGALKMGTGEFLKLAATYAFWGGAIPGLEKLAENRWTGYLLADSTRNTGTLIGPGSAIAALTTDGIDTMATMGSMIAQHGWSNGLDAFWNHYKTTVPGIVIKNSLAFWEKNIRYAFTDMPKDVFKFLWNTATDWDHPLQNIGRLYKGITAIYALTMMMRPRLRESLMRKFPKLPIVEVAMLPGAYMVAADINLATGVKPWHAWRIPFLGLFSQMRLQLMGGNRLDSMDWAAYMRAMIIPTLYTGTGAQMIGEAMQHSQSLYDDFKISMWVQAGLYPIGFVHAALVGSNISEQAKIKLWKSWREETVGNLARQNAGWDTLMGTFWSMFVQIFFQSWINTTWREASGAPMQRAAYLNKIQAPDYDKLVTDAMVSERVTPPSDADTAPAVDADSKTYVVPALARTRGIPIETAARIEGRVLADLEKRAKALENVAAQAGTRWDFWNWLKGKTWTERMPYVLAFYFAYKKKDAPFPTGFQDLYYRKVVFRTLIDPGIPTEEIEQYLRLLNIIVRDLEPTRKTLRENLLITTWAARNGPHGALIKEFFEKNGWIKEYYGVKDITPPENWGFFTGARRWFKKNLRRSDVSADGMRDDRTTWRERIRERRGGGRSGDA